MAGLPVDISAFTAKYAAMAVEHNLPFVAQQRVYNTRNAHELSHWALEQGKIDTWHRAVFDAYYGQARNIADPMVLADIAEALGLPAQQALAALEERSGTPGRWTGIGPPSNAGTSSPRRPI